MDWTVIGTLLTAAGLAGGAVGWLLQRRAARRAQAPRIVFSDLYFAGPQDRPREDYRYAIGVQLTNVGGGPAIRLTWGFADPDGERIYAELIGRGALVAGESTDDWAGIRGREQDDDPDEAAARAFYERCLAFAECWDSRGDHYIFFPFGGGRAPDPHGGPEALQQYLSQFPSRGEARRALGYGAPGNQDEA